MGRLRHWSDKSSPGRDGELIGLTVSASAKAAPIVSHDDGDGDFAASLSVGGGAQCPVSRGGSGRGACVCLPSLRLRVSYSMAGAARVTGRQTVS